MTTIITIQSLTCIVLFITVLILFRKNKNLLEQLVVYKRLEFYKKSEPPLHNLYIDGELILRNCITWNLDESTTPRKLTVKAEDSFLAYYIQGDRYYFIRAEKDTETPEEDHY